MAANWRDVSTALVDVGRCLEEIEIELRQIRATGAVPDNSAWMSLQNALSASRKLTRSLNEVAYTVSKETPT